MSPREFVHWMARAVEGTKGGELARLILAHGRDFVPGPEATVLAGRAGECYRNAFRLAEHAGLVYCEGYAAGQLGMPVPHGWCADPATGLAIDPTWRQAEGRSYFGIPFDLNYVRAYSLERGSWGILIDGQRGYPILQAAPNLFRSKNLL